MKWLIAGCMVLGCTGLGVNYYRRSWQRVQFYHALIAFCHTLVSEIGFSQKPLALIVADYQLVNRGHFRAVLQQYHQLLVTRADITRAQCAQMTTEPAVAEFFYQLGRMGSADEQQKIQTALQTFTAQKKQAEQDLHGKASITCKLLIIIGIAGAILWI